MQSFPKRVTKFIKDKKKLQEALVLTWSIPPLTWVDIQLLLRWLFNQILKANSFVSII